jgi:hypothetical protein
MRIYARVHLIIPGHADRHYEVSPPSLRRRGERPFDIIAGELGTTKARLRRTARVSSVRLLFRLSEDGPPLALVRDYAVCRSNSARYRDRRLALSASHMHMLLPMRSQSANAGFRIVSFLEESDVAAPAHVLGRASDALWGVRGRSLKKRIAGAAAAVGQWLFLGSHVMGCRH